MREEGGSISRAAAEEDKGAEVPGRLHTVRETASAEAYRVLFKRMLEKGIREQEKAEKARDEALFKEAAEAKKKAKKQKAMSWTRILKGMEKTGLSYGEYVARYENDKS